MVDTVYTIGYTGFTISDFINTLKANNISLVVDVRSQPYSQWFADYNKDHLEFALKQAKACFDSINGITYKDMSVTDRDFYDLPNNTMIGDAFIVVSLPDSPFMENRYYKFVAKIFPLNVK